MKAKPVEITWTILGKLIHEKRATSDSPEAIARHLLTLRCRDYPMADLTVDGKSFA